MPTSEIIKKLRTERGMTQNELAERVFVTRQAVSRWECGETSPNPETLKLLSRLFEVSINMSSDSFPPDKAREYFSRLIPSLGHWEK